MTLLQEFSHFELWSKHPEIRCEQWINRFLSRVNNAFLEDLFSLLCLWTCSYHSKPLAVLSNGTVCYSVSVLKVKFGYFVALTTSGSFWLKQLLSTVYSSVQRFNRLLISKKVFSTMGSYHHWFFDHKVRERRWGWGKGGGGGRNQKYYVRLTLNYSSTRCTLPNVCEFGSRGITKPLLM